MSDVAAGRAFIPRLSTLARFTFVDVILWCLRIGVTVVVVGGTIGTLIKGTYEAAQWVDLVMFGLTLGSVYALIALGYTMVYGVLRLINFAHGDIFMVGAYAGLFAAVSLGASGGTWWGVAVVFVVSMAVCALLGMLIERGAYRPLRNAPRLTSLITAIGISLLLEYGGQVQPILRAGSVAVPFGPNPQA